MLKRKLCKISLLIFSSLVLFQSALAQQVHAEELEVSTINTKLESSAQTHVKGTNKQLANVDSKTMSFIKSIAFEAHISGNESGLFPSITIAQAVLESNNGKSDLSKEPNNNLFGIKGSYKGKSVKLVTKEDDGTGNMYSIHSNFKKYPDKSSSIKDHDKLLKEGLDGYYKNVWRDVAKTQEKAAKALQGTYASDTKYASKLMYVIDNYNLKRFDKELSERDLAWLSSDSLDPWELPAIKKEISKELTWGSTIDIFKPENNSNDYSKHYIEGRLGEKIGSLDDYERFKSNPKEGDVAIYEMEDYPNGLVEKYGVVEEVRKNSLVISREVEGPSGLHIINKEFPELSFFKLEFISKDEIKE